MGAGFKLAHLLCAVGDTGEHGTIWEIAALGGEPRRVASALSGGDISHDGRRIALFRFEGTRIALVVVDARWVRSG